MTINERKRILYFLESLQANIESNETNQVSPELLQLFSKKELIPIVLWLHSNYDKSFLTEKTEKELQDLIKDDSNILAYLIELLEMELGALPSFVQADVSKFFESVNCEMHYLASKKVEAWDNYDKNNYLSLLHRMGKTKMVYGIFSSEIKEEEKYEVTVFPSEFFDTEEEAKKEMKSIIKERKLETGSLKVMPLWKTNL